MKSPSPKPKVVLKRLTRAEKSQRAERAEQEKRVTESITDSAKRANKLRSKDREFHGLEREFMYHQEDMKRDYERSKDVQHPRDKGMAREQIVRRYLTEVASIPGRYSVTDSSVRVVSTTGHSSHELDILFFDPLDTITLMRRENAFSVLPIESTYGAIQVKSKLTRKELRNGLDNIASYKRLAKNTAQAWSINFGRPKSANGFGILFAFDSDLDWQVIVDDIEAYAKETPREQWCNAIFILSRGFIMHGEENRAAYAFNEDMAKITNLQMHGYPDRSGLCFYSFYSMLIELLNNTRSDVPRIDAYTNLPFVAGPYSYRYMLGHFAEFGVCNEHGDFARKLTEKKLEEVIEWCKSAEPVNWIRALDIAQGKPGDNQAAYDRQPMDVRIYNPDALPLSEILFYPRPYIANGKQVLIQSIAYDAIETLGMVIWIPIYYEATRGIINTCPKCEITPSPKKSAK